MWSTESVFPVRLVSPPLSAATLPLHRRYVDDRNTIEGLLLCEMDYEASDDLSPAALATGTRGTISRQFPSPRSAANASRGRCAVHGTKPAAPLSWLLRRSPCWKAARLLCAPKWRASNIAGGVPTSKSWRGTCECLVSSSKRITSTTAYQTPLFLRRCLRTRRSRSQLSATAVHSAGSRVEFIEENGGGPGVRLKRRRRAKSLRPDQLNAESDG